LEGKGILKINDETYKLEKDDSAYVPSNSKQCIKNTGISDLKFLCIVEPAWRVENEILLE
jgi:mannose-6-phosphate isomerase-like protein (cupin superfamily)